ncbi:MAG TPA: prepilin peptidase [Anaerolineales bacterium]|nr:prepilin peptidase [Anaerolineales bacterium]
MAVIFALLGLLLGALINLLADILPRARRPEVPRCRACGAPRPPRTWLSIVALVLGEMRCSYCGASQGVRRLVAELVATIGAVLLSLRYAEAWPLTTGILAGFVFLLITVIDLEHRLILHMVSIPSAIALGVLRSLDPGQGPAKTLAGGAAGFLILLAMYGLGIVFSRVLSSARGRPLDDVAFGFGDVMLGGVLGLTLGWPGVIVAIVLGILAAGAFSFGMILFRLYRRTYTAFLAIPYGPFLILGAAFVLYAGRETLRGLFSG